MAQHIATVKPYSYQYSAGHGKYYSTNWAQVQLMKSIIGLDQLALMALEMDPGLLDSEREQQEQNLNIQSDT